VVRIVLTDDPDDLCLRLRIDLTDEVVAALGRDRKGLDAVHATNDDLAGAAGGANSDIEKRVHGN
jgi:hypothetical protein